MRRSSAILLLDPEVVFLGRVTSYKGLSRGDQGIGAAAPSEYSILARLVVVVALEFRSCRGDALAGRAPWRRHRDRVAWAGDTRAAAAALTRAHALIVPSLWEEPFPLVTVEGALARVPLVAADVGGIGKGMRRWSAPYSFARGDAPAAAGPGAYAAR